MQCSACSSRAIGIVTARDPTASCCATTTQRRETHAHSPAPSRMIPDFPVQSDDGTSRLLHFCIDQSPRVTSVSGPTRVSELTQRDQYQPLRSSFKLTSHSLASSQFQVSTSSAPSCRRRFRSLYGIGRGQADKFWFYAV